MKGIYIAFGGKTMYQLCSIWGLIMPCPLILIPFIRAHSGGLMDNIILTQLRN